MTSTIFNILSPDVMNGDNTNPPALSQEEQEGKQSEPKKRTRTGCLNCSRRRRKCDEQKPTCTGCKRRDENCQWRVLGSFRDANIKILESDHPSMSQGGAVSKGKRQSKFKIMNALPDQPRTKGVKRPMEQSPDPPRRKSLSLSPSKRTSDVIPEIVSAQDQSNINTSSGYADRLSHSNSIGPPLSPPLTGNASSNTSQGLGHNSPIHDDIEQGTSHLHQAEPEVHTQYSTNLNSEYQSQLPDDASPHTYLNSSPEYIIDDLTALRNLNSNQFHSSVEGSYQTVPSPLFDHSVFSDPADLTNDVFLPGSAYEALHTALRNRQLWTARPDVPRQTSSRGSISQAHTPSGLSDTSFSRSARQRQRSRPGRYFDLSPEREHILWQNYLNEICSWVSSYLLTNKILSTNFDSLTCLTTTGILPRRSLKWQKQHHTCDTQF